MQATRFIAALSALLLAASSAFPANIWNSGSSSSFAPPAGNGQRPIVAAVGHSFVSNFSGIFPVTLASKSAGTVTLTTSFTHNLSSTAPLKITGCGAPYDQAFIVAGSSSGTSITYTVSDTSSGSITPATIPGCFVYNLGQNNVFGGFASLDWLEWANVALGSPFEHPRSYMLPSTGGGFLSLFVGDPGFVLQMQRLASKNPPPAVIVVDNGINDCNSAKSVSAIMASVQQGVNVANAWTKNVVIMLPRPQTQDIANVNRCVAGLNQALILGAQNGKWYVDDTRKRLTDPTSSVGGMLTAYNADNLHTNALGNMEDGLDFANKFGFLFPTSDNNVSAQTDAYSATFNPAGDLIGGFPIAATASLINLTGSLQTIGTFQALVSGAGSSTATAQIVARTDTFPDGTTVPGNELVLKFSAGTGAKTIQVVYGTLSGPASVYGFGIIGGSTLYNAGDQIWTRAAFHIDPASLGAATFLPTCVLQENGATNQFFSIFTDQNTGIAGYTVPDGVMEAGPITTQAAPNYVLWSCSFIVGGTFATTPTIRIRDMSIRINNGFSPKIF